MTIYYYGVALGGQNAADVTKDTSSNSTDIELAVDDTNVAAAGSSSKERILLGLEAIKQKIIQDGF